MQFLLINEANVSLKLSHCFEKSFYMPTKMREQCAKLLPLQTLRKSKPWVPFMILLFKHLDQEPPNLDPIGCAKIRI